MKRIIAILLAFVMTISGCASATDGKESSIYADTSNTSEVRNQEAVEDSKVLSDEF